MRSKDKSPKTRFLVVLGVFTSLIALNPIGAWAEIYVNYSPISLGWEPASGLVAHYNVYVSVNGRRFTLLEQVPTNRCKVDVQTGRSYVLQIEAEDSQGNVGPLSDPSDRIVVFQDDGICDDGIWCNGAETNHPVFGCSAGSPRCVDDGLFCNGREFCDEAGDRCYATNVPDCRGQIGCTVGYCNEARDSCDRRPSDSLCDDGIWCNGREKCDVSKGCQPGGAPCVSDGNDCTNEYCNEAADSCEYTCKASSYDAPCCEDSACSSEPICSRDWHPCDLNADGCVQMSELLDYLDSWYEGDVTMHLLLEAIDLWYSGDGC